MNTERLSNLKYKGTSGSLERIAVSVSNWSEKWFPEAYIFAALAVIVVTLAAMSMGVPLVQIARGFGDGYWTLIPFTMQMALVAISGYIVAVSPLASRLINSLASMPRSARCCGARGMCEPGYVVVQLGDQLDPEWLVGQSHCPAPRRAPGLPGRGGCCLLGYGRYLGLRSEFVRCSTDG